MQMNDHKSRANSYAVDGMLNYETVKYFTNEDYELRQYDETLDIMGMDIFGDDECTRVLCVRPADL